MKKRIEKLNHPVWYSLVESPAFFGLDYTGVKCYQPDYCVFGGIDPKGNKQIDLLEYANLTPSFFIFGAKPQLPTSLKIDNCLPCLQMMIENEIKVEQKDEILPLKEQNMPDLLGLVKVAYPEYFKPKTAQMGNYYGIYKQNKLVAITGERMKMDDFTEVSAVITHPQHRQNGYAEQLVAHTVNTILEASKTPYLHVSAANIAAVNLYQKLGFCIHQTMDIWKIVQA